jgi:hypothetical protein
MKKITESQLINLSKGLREYLGEMGGSGGAAMAQQNRGPNGEEIVTNPQGQKGYYHRAGRTASFIPYDPATANANPAAGNPAVKPAPTAGQPAAATKPAPTAGQPAKPAVAPKVNYEKDFPHDTAVELQQKLNAAGEKLAVDGKMGPATRAAMARHPEITSQSASSQAVSADINQADKGPATPAANPAANNPVVTPPAPAQQPSTVTYSPNNPWVQKQDTARQDAWEKLSPDQQKWLGKADPTDPIIAYRMKQAVPDNTTPLTPQQQAQNVMQPSTNQVTARPNLTMINGKPVEVDANGNPVQKESVGYDEVQRLVNLIHYK